jgi:alkylation response protein AidB-like acyl-CoA dehydrogenase
VITETGETLADRQVIQHWVAELDAEIRAARLLTLHAAWVIDRDGAGGARDEISAIKFVVANTMLRTVDLAIQVHGALGVTDDTILAHWYRHERAARIYDGADEVHKTTLGRRILGRSRTDRPTDPAPRPDIGRTCDRHPDMLPSVTLVP